MLFNEAERIRDWLAEIRSDIQALDRVLGTLGYTGDLDREMPDKSGWLSSAKGELTRATEAGKEALRSVSAGLAIRVGCLMVDPLREVQRVQRIPMPSFVGMDDGAGLDPLCNQLHWLRFALEHEGQCPPAALAHDHNDPTLAGLILSKATTNAVLRVV